VQARPRKDNFATDLSFTASKANKQQLRQFHASNVLLKKDYYKVLGVKRRILQAISKRRITNLLKNIILTQIRRLALLKGFKKSKKHTRF